MSFRANTIKHSKTSGVVVGRDGDGKLHVGLSRGEDVSNNCVFDEDEENPKVTEGLFCGPIPPTGLSTVLDTSSGQSTPPNSTPARTTSATSTDEPVVCDEAGLIISMFDGYYLFYLDPNPDDHPDPYYKYLGSNAGHECIKASIGKLEKYPFSGTISGQNARWAFEDNRRIHVNPVVEDVTRSSPMWPPWFGDYNQTYSIGSRAVTVPHYGYYVDDTARIYRALPNFGGCGEFAGFIKWSREHYIYACLDSDHYNFDTQGLDVEYFPSNSIRIGAIADTIDCGDTILPTGDNNERLRVLTNIDRICESEADGLIDDTEMITLAEDYAQEMADNDFLSHVSEVDGSTLESRCVDYGIEYVSIAEVLAAVPGELIEEDAGCDAIFAALKASEEHYNALMGNSYVRGAFSIAFNSDTLKWYCCGLIRVTEDDALIETNNRIVLPSAPDAWNGDFTGNSGWTLSQIGTCYKAFSTVPTESIYLSCLSFEKLRASAPTLTVNVRDYMEWGVVDNTAITGPIEEARVANSSTPVITYPERGYSQGGAWKRGVVGGDGDPFNEYYIEYDVDGGRDIYLKLRALDYSGSAFDDTQVIRTFSRPYTDGDTLPDGSTWTGPDEAEPELIQSLFGGETELFVGTTLISDSSDSGSGSHINPFRTIVVSSVFHSNSGYTVITYTRTKTLNNTACEWDGENGKDVYERYWRLKQTLWCAVIDNVGAKVVDFELKGTHPPPEGETSGHALWTYGTEQAPPDEPQEQTFIAQTNGDIKRGSVEFYAIVNGHVIYLYDDEEGGLVEAPYQDPNNEFVVSSSSINYTSGVISVSFGSERPDYSSDITFIAYVWPFESLYESIASYHELAQYSQTVRYSSHDDYIPMAVGMDGVQASFVNATITEDGNYLVVGMRIGRILSSRLNRLSQADGGWFSSLGDPFTELYGGRALQFGDHPHQVIIYDMSSIALSTPALVAYPFLIDRLKKGSDTLVLN